MIPSVELIDICRDFDAKWNCFERHETFPINSFSKDFNSTLKFMKMLNCYAFYLIT